MSSVKSLLRYSPLAILLAVLMVVSGCSDTLMNSEVDSSETATNPNGKIVPGDKTRHFGMLDEATYTRAGKDGEETYVNLMVAYSDDGVSSQGIIDRYGIIDPYGIIDRYGIIDPYGIIDRFGIIDPFGMLRDLGVLEDHGIIQRFEFTTVMDGMAITVREDMLERFLEDIGDDSDIAFVEPDVGTSAPNGQVSELAVSTQVTPWGVEDIGGIESSTASGDGSGSVDVDVYVLDTGTTHGDINVASCKRVEHLEDGSYELVACETGDENGHGTAVGSVAGAVDDLDGLVGVAPGVNVHAVKVLDENGSGTTGAVVAALDRIVAANDGDGDGQVDEPIVVNLSVGTDVTQADDNGWILMDEAVKGAIDAGAVVTVAAGNASKNASDFSPAHVNPALTVASYGKDDSFSSFSNYGSSVDVVAPGENLEVLYGTLGLQTYSGTSISAPLAAGAAALYLSQNPTASPSDVHDAIVNAADGSVTGPNGSSYGQLNVSTF